jgi:hypothetical protein
MCKLVASKNKIVYKSVNNYFELKLSFTDLPLSLALSPQEKGDSSRIPFGFSLVKHFLFHLEA